MNQLYTRRQLKPSYTRIILKNTIIYAKKFIIIFLLPCCITNQIHSQSIINQIETFYFQLDSVSYLKSLENAIIESVIRDFQEPLESHIQWKYNQIKNGIADKNIKFVLNIEIDITKLESDTYDYIKIDTSRYNFNVYCFNKRNFPVYYIFFLEGELDFNGDFFPTFSKSYSKQIKLGFRNVLKKQPQYILNCYSLPNTILYVLNEKIFVYRVKQKDEYEFSVYMKDL